jgi:predicted amidohydrolase
VKNTTGGIAISEPTRPQPNVLVVQCGPATPVPTENVEANIRLIYDNVGDETPDFVVLSELSSTQYFCGYNDPAYFGLAEPIEGPSVERFREVARDLGSYVLFPFYERGVVDGEFFNSVVVIDPDGELVPGRLPNGRMVRCYRKNHIPDQYSYEPGLNERYYFKAGPGLASFDTAYGRIGVLICYERSFPEAWRVHALQGAGIIFLPVAAWGPNRSASWGHELLTAAVQNGVFIVASNKGGGEMTEGPVREFYGGSRIITPMGKVIAEAPKGDGPATLRATLDLALLTEHGVRYTFFRDRRPDLYTSLSDDSLRNVL